MSSRAPTVARPRRPESRRRLPCSICSRREARSRCRRSHASSASRRAHCTGSAPFSSIAAGQSGTATDASRSASEPSVLAPRRRSYRSSRPSRPLRRSSSRGTTRASRSRFSTASSRSSSRSRRRRSRSGSSPTWARRLRRLRRRAGVSSSRRIPPLRWRALYGGKLLVTPTGRRLNGVAELHAILAEVGEQGYAENVEETADGLYAASVAVTNDEGVTLAALTTLVPVSRIDARAPRADRHGPAYPRNPALGARGVAAIVLVPAILRARVPAS